jgi:hypothetical protein
MTSRIKTEPISVRDFLRNFATLVTGKTFKQYVIMKHGKPVGVFTPWEAQKKELKQQYPGSFWDWVKENQFAGDPDLSQHIDEIAYGIGRDTIPD